MAYKIEPKRIRVTIDLGVEDEAVSRASSYDLDNSRWTITVTKRDAEKYGLIPTLAHELGHVVSVVCNDPVAMKDARLNRSVAMTKDSVVSGTNIYQSEKRAWDIGQIIVFGKAKFWALRTYEYMLGKWVNLLEYDIKGEEDVKTSDTAKA